MTYLVNLLFFLDLDLDEGVIQRHQGFYQKAPEILTCSRRGIFLL